MPVSKNSVQEGALMTAEALGITRFQASNEWLDCYLLQSPIQPSYKLRGKGDSWLPNNHASAMANVSSVSSQCELRNIWNMDESGLFFRTGPIRSYLPASESRSQIRGTEFGKYKDTVAIVLAHNADGQHHKPVAYIGSAKNPRCFGLNRYDSLKTKYRSQENGLTDLMALKIGSSGGTSRFAKSLADPGFLQ